MDKNNHIPVISRFQGTKYLYKVLAKVPIPPVVVS